MAEEFLRLEKIRKQSMILLKEKLRNVETEHEKEEVEEYIRLLEIDQEKYEEIKKAVEKKVGIKIEETEMKKLGIKIEETEMKIS